MSSSKLAVGIVGLPNVGKSTLFNALLKKQASFAEASAGQAGSGGRALVGNYPFTTIEPNIGIVPVPDKRLEKLAKIYNAPIVPATVEFKDIAGLIEGASKGEGLGNKFLSHIRETDAICFVLRAFSDPDIIKQGVKDPKSDLEILKIELDLADLDHPDAPPFKNKPFLVVLNVDEKDLNTDFGIENAINICAKTESELSELSEEDQKNYLEALGIRHSGLERLIQKAFSTLGLITFLTAGEKEVRAWTIRLGTTSLMASGVIHTEFMKKFIKADVCAFEDFVSNNGWKAAREAGKVRSEGRDYIMQDGDVVEFKIGS